MTRRRGAAARALPLALLALLPACHRLASRPPPRAEPDPQTISLPVASFWYGSAQRFGSPGFAQRWVNVLGRVSRPEQVVRSRYAVNGGRPSPLRLGPDRRRLRGGGDFNVEIDPGELGAAANRVTVEVVDELDQRSARTAKLHLEPSRWPLPYRIRWKKVRRLGDAVQVVDGLWEWSDAGVRTHPGEIGYDRVLAVGGRDWTDYELTLPISVHGVDASAYGSAVSVAPGLGVHLHWQGHTDHPVRCPPPHCGWEPMGASVWLDFGRKELRLNARGAPAAGAAHIRPEVGRTYRFRIRSETAEQGRRYRLKAWHEGEKEPAEWTLESRAPAAPASGSFLLVAHHVDATFGDLSVEPITLRTEVTRTERP
jgi:hypothetical protein